MPLPELQQASALIKRATRTLLLVGNRPTKDDLASMIALYLALEPQKNDGVDLVSASHLPPQLQFLSGSSQITMQPKMQPEITLDIAGPSTIEGVRTIPLQGGIRLYITLPAGSDINKSSIETSVRELPYELVITLGVSDLEGLGNLFAEQTDFFYNTPIINIDHRADNEHFGTINIVDITASSVAEVTHQLIFALSADISSDIATALYAGIVSSTDSFQKPSTTPRSFSLAAKLIEQNADKESVIQYLVKTKPLSLLKLVGRLYARLRYDKHAGLFWSVLQPIDFSESATQTGDLADAMHELTNNISGFNVAYVLNRTDENNFDVYLQLGKGLLQRRDEIQTILGAKRDNGLMLLSLTAPSIDAAEQKALEKIRQILP